MENPAKERRAEELFIRITPSKSGRADIYTIDMLNDVAFLMQKGRMPVVSRQSGLARARTWAVKKLKEHMDKAGIKHGLEIKALWFDDDIVIDQSADVRQLATALLEADMNGWNLVANYKVPYHDHDENALYHRVGDGTYKAYTDAEIADLKPMQLLPNTVAGMGFMYCATPLDYEFHDDSAGGEDIYFCEENKLEFHYLPIMLFHTKQVYI